MLFSLCTDIIVELDKLMLIYTATVNFCYFFFGLIYSDLYLELYVPILAKFPPFGGKYRAKIRTVEIYTPN